MRHQGAYNPVAFEKHVTEPKAQAIRWVSSRKVMCWGCQKEYHRHEGRTTSIINRKGQLITKWNTGNKFVCFNCRPKEVT